jgi:manganese/zinc/iron transport system permease protein
MIVGLNWIWALDGWIVAVAMLCAVASALLGNFLILRRMSMLGDAITHAVLPGLAVAFFVSHSRSSLPMFLGAVIVGILTAFFTEWIRRVGKVDEGASMGVVFTSLFALGLVMIVQAADKVDLDAGCVLYGSIELTPLDTVLLLERPAKEGASKDERRMSRQRWVDQGAPAKEGASKDERRTSSQRWVDQGAPVPRAFLTLGVVTVVNLLFVVMFYKELKLSSFDPELATTTGFNASLMHYLLMVLVAVTAVASFESVGSVLVVAMFIVPPATAYMLTDRLHVMIGLSLIVAILSAILGHVSALVVPGWFGFQSTTTAGMMAVAAGGLLLCATLLGPRHGILVKLVRRQLLSLSILADDVVAVLYRIGEQEKAAAARASELKKSLFCSEWSLRGVLAWLDRQGAIERSAGMIALTEQGRLRAQHLVRSHRLWEQYLQDYAGIDASRVHPQAEKLEHFTDPRLRQQLDSETDAPQIDPHGRPIPSEIGDQRHES